MKKKPNVLIVNQSDVVGGAAIAGYRLYSNLNRTGVNANLLTGLHKTEDPQIQDVSGPSSAEKILGKICKKMGLLHINRFTASDILKHPFYRQADLINFHNLHTGFFNYLAIPKLTATKPGVMTLHDMWSFTGHCAYSFDCARWESGCGKCPHLGVTPAVNRDATRIEWWLKNRAYSKSNLNIVCPSRWLFETARKSMLGRHFEIHHIPYGIDLDVYHPMDKEKACKILDIQTSGTVLLFGVPDLKIHRKGGDLLLKVLRSLSSEVKEKITLVIFGASSADFVEQFDCRTLSLGYLHDDLEKTAAFSLADIFLFPTRADNLPLVLLESLACGTPVVSFNVGGVPDLVRPGETGLLADPEDLAGFRDQLVKLISDPDLRNQMSRGARELSIQDYSAHLESERYLGLFESIIASGIVN